jgi:branched-chain amino acid transport system substrate-binding protein
VEEHQFMIFFPVTQKHDYYKKPRRIIMKIKKNIFSTILSLLLLLSFFTACAPAAPAETTVQETAPTATTPMKNEVLKIGFAMDMTGPGAEWFVPFGNILEMEIARINQEGGIEVAGKKYDLQLVKETTNLTPEGARAAAEKLMYQDGIKIMWGAGILDETMGLQDVTMPNKVLNLTAGWGQEILSGALVDGKIVNPYNYTIAIIASSRESTPGLWRYVSENYPTFTRVADITIDTVASHWGFDEVESKILPEYGLTSVIQEFYEPGITDFYSILTRVLKENPDIIHCSNSPPNEWSLIMKQAREMGFEGLFVREEMISQNEIDMTGAENIEGLIGWDFPAYGDTALPEYKDLVTRYTAMYGRWDAFAPVGVRMLPVLINAMQEASTVDDTEKIIQTLISHSWQSYGQEMVFCGMPYYGLDHYSITPLSIVQVQNGQVVPVGTISNADQCEFWKE